MVNVSRLLCWFALFFALSGICLSGNVHADSSLDAWRNEISLARTLAENDTSAAYKEARRLQLVNPSNAMPADQARVLNLLARIEVYKGDTAAAAMHAQQAFELAKLHGDKVGRAEADLNIALNAVNQGKLDAMASAINDSMTVLDGVDRPDLLSEAMLRTAMMYRRSERFEESVAMAVQALEIAKRSQNTLALVYAYQGIAVSYDLSARYKESGEYFEKMLDAARAAHSKQLEASALLDSGTALSSRGQFREGEQKQRQAIELFRAVGMPFNVSRGYFALAENLHKQGRLAETLPLYQEVISTYEAGANKIGLWWTLNARSTILQAMGRVEQANADAERAYQLALEIGFPIYQSNSARRLAAIAAVRGQHKRAYELFAESVGLAEKAALQKSSNQIGELAKNYEAQSRQKQIDELTRRDEQQRAEIRQRMLQQRWLWTLLASITVVLGGTIFFMLRLRRSREEIRALNTSLEQRVSARTDELRQQTRYLRTLIDMLPVMAWLKDTESRFLAVNRAVASAAGQPADVLIGKTDLDFFPREMAESYRADDVEVMSTQKDKIVEEQIAGPQGKTWVETYKAPVLDEDGTVLGTVGVARDITESKAVAEAREAALAEAQRLARMRSEFLAQMSHELRTPLNGILGYSQVLRRNKNLDERQIAGLNVIQQCGEHLLTLINDILDSAKIESGKQELNTIDIPLKHFLRAIAEIIRVKADVKHLYFVCDFAPDLPEIIRADEKRLRQILLNLLANAIKFTDHGQVSLHVAFQQPSWLTFAVRDNGIGIAKQDMESIFQPFEQVGELQRRLGGTGLGLAISRQFVRLMGGDIEVESEVGQGSVFRFTLNVPVVNGVANVAPVTMVNGYQGERKRVLVVDDIVENRTLLVDLLGQIGFDMAQASNGREAVQVAGAFMPDLILMDIYMPEMDGLDAIRLLRQLPRSAEVPIIAVSASASGSDEDTCLAAGADAFLSKPVDMDRLLKQIASLLKLEWICEPSEVGKPPPQTSLAPLTIPPQEEMEVLHQMALQGNMRDIIQRASSLAESDERYRAFVDQLQLLARGYQSKTLLSFVERYLNRKASQ